MDELPFILKKLALQKNIHIMFQKAVPIRYKTIAIYNESTIFDLALAIAKPFMTDKMKERVN